MDAGLIKRMLARFVLFVAGISFMLMPVPAGATLKQSQLPGAEKLDMPYWHVWTDENGVSRQDRCRMSNFEYASISSGAAPSWIDRMDSQPAHIVLLGLPVGWVGEWHENPEPQWIVPLSGGWFVETMDGKRVEMGPGELSFGNDQNTKPDTQGRRGHRSGTVGNDPCILMLVQVKQDPVNSRPCMLK